MGSTTGISWSGPVNLQPYDTIAADIYLPREVAGRRMSARFIIKVEENWRWCQAETGTPLVAGEWVKPAVWPTRHNG